MTTPATFGQAFTSSQSKDISQIDAALSRNKEGAIKQLSYKAFIVCQDQGIIVDAWLPETTQLDVNARYEAPYAQGMTGGLADKIGPIARFAGLSLTTQALTTQVWQGGSELVFSLALIFQAETSGVTDVMKPIKDLLKLTMPKDPSRGGLLEAPGPRLDPTKLLDDGGETVTKIFKESLTDGKSFLHGLGNVVSEAFNFTPKGMQNTSNGIIGSFKSGVDNLAKPLSKAIVNSVKNNISLYIGRFQYFPSVVITDVSPTFDVIIGPDNNPMRASVIVQFKSFYTPTDEDIELMFPSARDGDQGSKSTADLRGSRLG